MYTLLDYGRMAGDSVRLNAFEAALTRAIAPGAVVLEIGTGSGFFAVLACRLGAGRVYAIESNDCVNVAREIARQNGVADRITFFQERSTRVSLPERADLMFSDLRGSLPLLEDHIPTIVDARTRLLKPGGVQIPARDTIWVAPAEAEDFYLERVHPWGDNHRNVDLGPAAFRLASTLRNGKGTEHRLVADPQVFATLDYATISDPNIKRRLAWQLTGAGVVHGLSAWFDTELMPGVGYTTSVDAPEQYTVTHSSRCASR